MNMQRCSGMMLLAAALALCTSGVTGHPVNNSTVPEVPTTDQELHSWLAAFNSSFHHLEHDIEAVLGGEEGDDNSTTIRRGRAITVLMRQALSLLDMRRVVREIETSVMSSVSCTACKAGVGLLQHYIATKRSIEDIISAAVKVCIKFRIESERVCKGIVPLFAGEIVYVIRGVVLNPDEACGLLLGDACATPVSPLHSWEIVLPPVPKPSPTVPQVPPADDTPKLKVLHLSDTHYDPHYAEGSNAECGEPLCCRADSGPPKDPRHAAGKWGDYRKCDTPLRTIRAMLDHIAETHSDLDYIIWTGDLPPHDVWNQTRDYNTAIIRDTVSQLLKKFPKTPIFPALGNHEGAPVNSFPPPAVFYPDGPGTPEAKKQYSVSWLYDEIDRQWANWLPLSTSPTVRYGAFYSVLYKPGFRIISINTNYCNNKNWWLLLNSTDPASELQWLAYELQAAEFAQEMVHIIGHIPPGYADCLKIWSYNYYRIINRYESTVKAQFFGHTHYDEFELFFDLQQPSRAVSVAYIGPSVTPYYGLNPGYRIYHVDGNHADTTRLVSDHETWIMDLALSNYLDQPQWHRLYSARLAYGLSSLLPIEWKNFVTRMTADSRLFDLYHRYYWKDSPVRQTCQGECKSRVLCDAVSGRSHDRKETCKRVEADLATYYHNDNSESMQTLQNQQPVVTKRRRKPNESSGWSWTVLNGLATVYVMSAFEWLTWLILWVMAG